MQLLHIGSVDKYNNRIITELANKLYWDNTYNKMILKQGLSDEDKSLLWKLKEIYKEDIVQEIENGTYIWGIPRRVEIAKHDSNKKRIVYIYPLKDRFVQGVLYRVFSEVFKDIISDNCFSYQKEVSTSHAIQYLKKRRTEENKYGVKTDIHAYFNSVNFDVVAELLDTLFIGNLNTVMKSLMLEKRVLWREKEIEEWKALIPGSPIGSFFANICLKPLDDWFEEHNKIYARYSDDIVVLDTSKENLTEDLQKIQEYLGQLGLTMNPDKYQWFEPGDAVDFLGLKLTDNGIIDISDHSKQKIKKQIHRWCKKGRVKIERDHEDYYKIARRIVHQLNHKNFKCFIENNMSFGWCAYAFPRITTVDSLKEIDLYTKEQLRYLKTGKHNKANYRISEEEFEKIGWVSLVQLYYLFRSDFDYYCEVLELL